MNVLLDGILAFLSAVGLSALLWLLAGALLRCEAREGYLVLCCDGDGAGLEAACGDIRYRIVLVDCGLSGLGRQKARQLVERKRCAALLQAEELPRFLQQER